MRVRLRVDDPGDGRAGAPEKDLSVFLDRQQHLRGRVHLASDRGQGSGMTQSIVTIIVELGPATVGGFAGALVTWIRYRTSNTRLTVHRPDGARIELTAQRIRSLNPDQLADLVKQLTDAVDERPANRLPDTSGKPEITG